MLGSYFIQPILVVHGSCYINVTLENEGQLIVIETYIHLIQHEFEVSLAD